MKMYDYSAKHHFRIQWWEDGLGDLGDEIDFKEGLKICSWIEKSTL